MLNRDCQLMGLTWLLARNKTAYIPTVSAVLRAIMYSAHPQEYRCSPDEENMPLAVDSPPLPQPGCNAIAKTSAKAYIAFALPSTASDYWCPCVAVAVGLGRSLSRRIAHP